MAIQALEQQCSAKKSILRRQLERALDKIPLPKPSSSCGLSDVAFIPSTLSNEFMSLIGLEEVDFDPCLSGKSSESRRVFSPFACVRCGTDFTPVWKRERPGSSGVICETCLTGVQQLALQKDYEAAIDSIMKQHAASEKDVEKELKEIVNSPSRLESFIKEQEKKLAATQQAQLAVLQQQHQIQQQNQQVISQPPRYQQGFVNPASVAAGARHQQAVANSSVSSAAMNHLQNPVNAGSLNGPTLGLSGLMSSSANTVTSTPAASTRRHPQSQLPQQTLSQSTSVVQQQPQASSLSNSGLAPVLNPQLPAQSSNNAAAAAAAASLCNNPAGLAGLAAAGGLTAQQLMAIAAAQQQQQQQVVAAQQQLQQQQQHLQQLQQQQQLASHFQAQFAAKQQQAQAQQAQQVPNNLSHLTKFGYQFQNFTNISKGEKNYAMPLQ
ncbi:unnamed protein product [Protopolystoma xenopodis]|uniref:GATA-type domain-containing protein n=1 Tax=Protopolystoma xenopodis TaxID=117903 RepID=A0A3S5AU54_9PLAT|nr:unnamed protein product [Protopolystoma xenopodis]